MKLSLLVGLSGVALGMLGGMVIVVKAILWREEQQREFYTAEAWHG